MRILVCIDGEPHTRDAVEQAIALSHQNSAELVGVHVIDEWLRQFSSEIYAQGRKEYLEWVDQCLEEKASEVREAFMARCSSNDVRARFVLRDGDRAVEIAAVIDALEPDLVITGGRELTRWQRFRSSNLVARLRRACGSALSMETVTARQRRPDAVF